MILVLSVILAKYREQQRNIKALIIKKITSANIMIKGTSGAMDSG